MSKQSDAMQLAVRAREQFGLSPEDVAALVRCEGVLHRWAEAECGGGGEYASWAIERDEETDRPYRVIYPHNGASYRNPVPDRERGAVALVVSILESYPGLRFYLQTDPRGCALYIYREGDQGLDSIRSCYSSVGLAMCLR
jgi:hypothetical protein